MATFHKRNWINNSAPDISAETLNELENDIQIFGNAIADELKSPYIESDESVSYVVTESISQFALPSNVTNYLDTNNYIICEINGNETTEYTLTEVNSVNLLTLNTAIESGTVIIRAIKFKKSFLDFLTNNQNLVKKV